MVPTPTSEEVLASGLPDPAGAVGVDPLDPPVGASSPRVALAVLPLAVLWVSMFTPTSSVLAVLGVCGYSLVACTGQTGCRRQRHAGHQERELGTGVGHDLARVEARSGGRAGRARVVRRRGVALVELERWRRREGEVGLLVLGGDRLGQRGDGVAAEGRACRCPSSRCRLPAGPLLAASGEQARPTGEQQEAWRRRAPAAAPDRSGSRGLRPGVARRSLAGHAAAPPR